MFDYFKKDKTYITISIIILFFLIFISYLFLNKDNDEVIYFEVQNVKKEVFTSNNNNEETFITTRFFNNDSNSEKQDKEEPIIEPIVLFSIISEEGKYSIRFRSDKTLDSEQDIVKYISLSGNIVKDSKTELFSLPLNENYIYMLNNITIEIINNETKEMSSCNGTFLNTILPEFSYYLQIDINNDSTHCYIKSQSEPKSSDNNLLKELKNDGNLDSQINMRIDENELKELRILDKE